jgi:hypothetical protein
MSWQLLIWNIFVWSFTGLMIYLTQSSLWWLILPALFTGTQNAIEMLKSVDEEDDLQLPTDEETKRKIAALLEQAKRGKL